MIGSRVMAVGDVHGQYDKLKKLMRKIKFDPAQDKLIFLGDLIDRGPESLQCFDYVMHLQKQHPESVIYLMGNHEREMLDYYDALAKTKDELDGGRRYRQDDQPAVHCHRPCGGRHARKGERDPFQSYEVLCSVYGDRRPGLLFHAGVPALNCFTCNRR